MIIYSYGNTLLHLALAVLVSLKSPSSAVAFTISALSLLGKGITSDLLTGVHIYGPELFPTVFRNSAFGTIGLAGRVGSLIAPHIILLVGLVLYSPMYLFPFILG